jgi:hypothetical protein
MTCRDWLCENKYEDVANLIDQAMAKMAVRGSKQRRNWWDILSGVKDGRPCVVEGIEFPVLRVAQVRQGKPVTANALRRSRKELPPDVRATERWRR